MTRYAVNATMTVPAWITVEADSPEAAQAEAAFIDARSWEIDLSVAELVFNVTPSVEIA